MGKILKVQRFCTDDGEGIRTTVFLKGCPLRCLWCHNPESQSTMPQLAYDKAKCVGCGRCAETCETRSHIFEEEHKFLRENCIACGKCISPACDALELFGCEMSAEEIIKTALRDKDFYEASGGGVTLSGGEPLSQSDFTLEILREAKAQGINTAVETCGYGDREALKKIAPYVDTFLYDIKETDGERHKKFTGVSNRLILENLKYLSEQGKRIILRCPIIPECNDRDDHFEAIGRLADLDGVCRVEVEPYHSFGEGKYARLGLSYFQNGKKPPTDEQTEEYVRKISASCEKPVIKLR